MAKMISILHKESQIHSLSSELRLNILRELVKGSSTCQKLAEIFNVSKQKVHYNLMQLQNESLIEIDNDPSVNNKEIYYKAVAKNYILDLSLGLHANNMKLYSRELLNSILEDEYQLSLRDIAAKLLDQSLKVKPGERLLITTGNYNMPLVEKLIIEAAKRSIKTHILYLGIDFYKALYNDYSLTQASNWYDYAIRLYRESDVALILNGETRYIVSPEDKMKRELQQRHRLRINELFKKKNGLRIATMIGFLQDNLSEDNFQAELEFWRSLDIDYDKLQKDTYSLYTKFLSHKRCRITQGETDLTFSINNVSCEYGSFGDYPDQSSLINLPGGEVLIDPEENSIKGILKSPNGFALGKSIEDITLFIENNEIVSYKAGSNEDVIKKAIERGGPDGRKISLICIGTNSELDIRSPINRISKHKSQGMMSIYWGNNAMVNGKVRGHIDWQVEIENPELRFEK